MASGQPGSALPHIQRLFAEGSLTGFSDGQLLERYLARRDELAFETLVERHAPMVLTVCRRSLDHPGDLDDAFQATFLVLARRSRAIRQREVLGSWLFGVSRRVCLLANRAAARRRKHERRAAEQKGARDVTIRAHDETGASIYEEIERLPSAYRLPVVLCLIQGRTKAEAAAELRWTEGMVRGRLARAKALLRNRLIRRGVAPAPALAALAREGMAEGAVPRGLIEGATQAATYVATGQAARAVSAAAAALTERVIKIMLLKKLTLSGAIFSGAILVAWAATAAIVIGADQNPPAGTLQAVAVPPAAPVATIRPGPIPLDDPGKSALHGHVVDPDGKPVAGARVWINTFQGPRLADARTDAEGYFRLGPVAPNYRNRTDLLIEADGFARQHIPGESYSLFPGSDEDLETIRLARGRVFTGQVLDTDGKPCPTATVECSVLRRQLGHTVRPIGPAHLLTTDAEGRFRTPPLEVGLLRASIQFPGRQLVFIARPIAPGSEEALEPVRLGKDSPVAGVVKDEQGKPVGGVEIVAGGVDKATSDADGRFTLRGFGPNPNFQMQLFKDQKMFANTVVSVTDNGFTWHDIISTKRGVSVPELIVTMDRVAWIEGKALDADTGEPVHLNAAVLRIVERQPDGTVRSRHYRDGLEQPSPGHFRVAYSLPGEYELILIAAGYNDAEAATPRVTELKTIDGITVRMKKTVGAKSTEAATQTIAGTVTRDGRPVAAGWVGLWGPIASMGIMNASILRGRTVEMRPSVFASAAIRDGAYELAVPHPDKAWYVVVEEPGQPITQVGPIAIDARQQKKLDITCVAGGRIVGRVKDVPQGWEGNLWVVAFNRTGIREETRVGVDGVFSLPQLPPGEYGLKVGHDAYEDAEVPRALRPAGRLLPPREKKRNDPWQRAKVVIVEAGRETSGVELELPK